MPEYGWDNSLSEGETIRRVSNLVAKGELKNAIALLEQALVSHSHSEKIRKVLSELYIRVGELVEARQTQESLFANTLKMGVNSDFPDNNDFAFLEEQSRKLSEEEYHFDQPKVLQPLISKSRLRLKSSAQEQTKTELNKVNILYKSRESVEQTFSREREEAEIQGTQPLSETQSTYDNQQKATDDYSKCHKAQVDDNHAVTEKSSISLAADDSEKKHNKRRTLSLKPTFKNERECKTPDVTIIYKSGTEKPASSPLSNTEENERGTDGAKQKAVEWNSATPKMVIAESQASDILNANDENQESYTESVSPTLYTEAIDINELKLDEDDFDFLSVYVDEQDTEGAEESSFGPALFDLDDGNESFAFDDNEAALYDFWDDESEELQEESTENTAFLDNKLSREERARIVAADCIMEFDWHAKQLPFVIEVFSTLGWSSAKIALAREVQSGTTVAELELAFAVKKLWQDSSRYWITFSKVRAPGESTDATYRHCSWKQALHLIRLFEQLPTLDEIYDFLEREFDRWYHNRVLRSCFPAFNKYLFLYRLNSRNEISTHHGFGLPDEQDGLDAQCFSHELSNPMMKLNALGIDLVSKYTTRSC
ncbi:tetratricopeptide repeat protein [Salinivibrio sp. IB872]|uniref:tetratricopeptide repeat protein n=1 Tax=Salinivibrio sp. IB872 TaxID=1766123 RepID=UPI001056CAED|nr:tetratricopeptide repeat protein [Salinivibrio sp. IB872]